MLITICKTAANGSKILEKNARLARKIHTERNALSRDSEANVNNVTETTSGL